MNLVSPKTLPALALDNPLAIDIREPFERQGADQAILAMPNVPRNEWHTIPERFPERPLVLCCAAGIRTRICLDMLKHPEGIYAWTASIHDWTGA